MTNQIQTTKQNNRKIQNLDEREKALLSIILMNKGKIKGTRLKRIYLEKYSLWDLQSTQAKLKKKGLLVKNVGELGAESSIYAISLKFHSDLESALSQVVKYPTDLIRNEGGFASPCQEFSILWYLMEVDSILEFGLIGSNPKKINRLVSRRVEDLLGLSEDDARFIIYLIKDLVKSKFFRKNKINKWIDVLKSPSHIVKKIFRMVYYDLSDHSTLGRGDVGKDNIDFLIDEIEALRTEKWFLLGSFVTNAKTTLYSANQPDRWIHFNEENIWKIINRELKLIQVVNAFENPPGKRFFNPTIMGDYCLDNLSEEEFRNILNQRKGRLLVHPNFEVTLVSKEVNPRLILELAMFSNIIKVDTVNVFKISRGSVEMGIKRGLEPHKMIGFLKKNCKGEVPQNVDYSILDWGE